MCLALGDSVELRLYMAIWNDRVLRDACIDRVIATLEPTGRRVAILDMVDEQEGASLVSRLGSLYQKMMETRAGPVTIAVINFEPVIGSRASEGETALQAANLQRDRLPVVCPAPVVLWLTPEASASFARVAPDLWHWRSGTFRFLTAMNLSLDQRSSPPDDARWADVDAIEAELRVLDALPSASTPRVETQRARLKRRLGQALFVHGDWDRALIRLQSAKRIFETQGNDGERAFTLVTIADILQARGELGEALRTLREEVLPAFQRLGDERSCAMTMGKIADNLHARGDLDEALRIFSGEVLPAFDKVGDLRSRAVTIGKIADILFMRGQLDEALHVLRQEALPAFERVGDVQSGAAAMGKIADILFARRQLAEALQILREEVLPAFERLGDLRSRAMTMRKIANILEARGQLAEALHILREEVLPAFEQLGDLRSRAVTIGNIADILQEQGYLDEALRIRKEEELPVHQRLGGVRERAVTMGKIADILRMRRQVDEAVRIQREDVLPVYERLGDVRSLLKGRANLATTLLDRGNDGDRAEAERLLHLALADAERLQLPEAKQIEEILSRGTLAAADR